MPDVYGSELAVYKDRYITNTRLQIQVSKNLYDGCYMPIVGLAGEKAQVVDIVGASNPIFDYPDKADTPTEDPQHEGIWVAPRKVSVPGKWVTDEAKLKTMVDYSGSYVQSHALTILRGQNQIIRDAILGSRLIKTTNNSLPVATAFDFANRTVAVNYVYTGAATNSGMTVQKFIKALELLGITDLDLDAEDICCSMTMKQNTDMLQDIKVTSKDYMDRAIFANDKFVRSFMGVKIIIDNKLSVNPAQPTYRRCPFWAKSGIHFGPAVEYMGEIDRVPTRQNQILIQGRGWYAATRSEDERVVNVECLEA
jgi:hypothetical protein